MSSVMPYLSDVNITNRIMPALITLSNDSNWFVYTFYFFYFFLNVWFFKFYAYNFSDVKIALVPVLGQLMMLTNNKDTIEKCRFQMKSLMDDRALSDTITFTTELITVFGKLAPKSDQAYREDGKNSNKIKFTYFEI